MFSVPPKAAAVTSLGNSSTSSEWEFVPDWHIRTDIHPLSVGPSVVGPSLCPGMSEQVAPTAQLHHCYNYITAAVVSRHTMPTIGNNNQGWITLERTSPVQGNYNITAGSALPSGNFSQVATTAAATAKCPPPRLPNDNATTLTAKPKGPKPPPGSAPSPHPTKAPPPTWQQPAREPWQPPSSETWQPPAREPWQPPPLRESWQSASVREPWQLPADHNRHQ